MKLETENGTVVHSPNPSDIERALRELTSDGNSFAILGPEEMTYVQACTGDDGMVLEYQDGDTGRHFQAASPVAPDVVIAAFQRYAAGDDRWRNEVQWQPMDIENAKGRGCASVILLAVVAFAGWFAS